MISDKVIRIGGGSAFFIDSAMAVPQLLGAGVDYIILDYLAEGAMGLLGRMRQADPASGFPGDFMDVHVGPFLGEIAAKQVRIVANAGGVNPAGLARLLRSKINAEGLPLRVACLSGDDLIDRDDIYDRKGKTSVNAYLGAFPIAAALAAGADIVITGRVVDSALALGPLIHAFGWGRGDLDLLAAGTLAGHLIECGAQATGGTFTDWREVDGWANIGSPIAECAADGSVVLTKPDGTGGLVSFGTVAEQLLYEVGDPAAYVVPDVTCDFTTVRLEEVGPDRVLVTGATGHAPPDRLKVCATWDDGWRAIAYQPVIGPAAVEKAAKQAEALFERGRAMLRARGMDDWQRTEMVPIGGGDVVVAKLIVEHGDMLACQMFAREQFSAISAMAPGTSVSFGVQVQPVMGMDELFVAREEVRTAIDMGEGAVPFREPPLRQIEPVPASPVRSNPAEPTMPEAPKQVHGDVGARALVQDLAWTRSGEKGETINVAVIARDPAYLDGLRAALRPDVLLSWFADLAPTAVQIYDVPGIHALNIVLEGALPGGLNASQRLDPAAKSLGQRLAGMPLDGRRSTRPACP